MARTFADPLATAPDPARRCDGVAGTRGCGVFFRALVDLDTGGVAGIEAAPGRAGRPAPGPGPGPGGRPQTAASLGAWGREVREPAAYLVRGGLDTKPEAIGASHGVAAGRIILMFDVAVLFAAPVRSLDLLLACKRAKARILLDNFPLDDPPARFMEMLPADILRVAPWNMPWHWDASRRDAALASVLAFAGNLLMDVAVEGVDGEERRKLRRLGVRYAQGGWRRDDLGLVPGPVRR
ncbi:EAL domain protein [Solidesulfovibrio carbinoliphilus subsp. oakridgensis]|uniref:EAL domain protein n=1 Tax=Solidesulfovibrio carbinoliphilus subsp. oakridgensis TaxID=694327 RepID=G7Q8Z7_9BACT|nr:EAL domain-containing protein [Solidesulfovibrio carbinoliphilus]EHJ47483.1 EAL domain protein [Solidesulfovibrio carbinoliphilus subsp. oakridgensis]